MGGRGWKQVGLGGVYFGMGGVVVLFSIEKCHMRFLIVCVYFSLRKDSRYKIKGQDESRIKIQTPLSSLVLLGIHFLDLLIACL